MEVALARGALAKVRRHHRRALAPLALLRRPRGRGPLLVPQLQRVRGAGRLRQLRRERRRDGVAVERARAVVHGHITPPARVAPVREQLVHEVGELEAARAEHAGLAVLREHDVLGLERARRPDRDALLARGHHVEAQPALALRLGHDGVEHADGQHVAVHFEEEFVRDVGRRARGVGEPALVVEDAVGGHGGLVGRVGRKASAVVNWLSTAPGKRTLPAQLGDSSSM